MSDVVNACLNLQGICGLSMTDFWQALKGAAQDDNFFTVMYLYFSLCQTDQHVSLLVLSGMPVCTLFLCLLLLRESL